MSSTELEIPQVPAEQPSVVTREEARRKGPYSFLKKLFNPGVGLMNRLKYPQKFVLITFLFLLPLSLLVYTFVREVNVKVEFAQKELLGTAYLRPLRVLLEDALQARILANHRLTGTTASHSDELTRVKVRLSKAMEALAASDRKWGAVLDTGDKSTAIRDTWRALQEQTAHPSLGASDAKHSAFIDDIYSLMSHVGDTSNLILDPDLDSYYCMDAVLLKLPAGQMLLTQTQLLSLSLTQQDTAAADRKIRLFILAGLTKSNLDETQKGLHTAFSNNPSQHLKPRLEQPLEKLSQASRSFFELVDRGILSAAEIKSEPAALDASAQKMFGASFKLWDMTIDELDRLLNKRIQRFEWQRNVTLVVTGLVLLLVAYLWVAFYFGVMGTVCNLEKAVQRMVGGDMSPIELSTRDELSMVVDSFNTIAARLQTNNQQLLANEERFRTLYEDNPAMCFTLDAGGDILSANERVAEQLGYSLAELRGQSVLNVFHEGDRKALQEQFSACLENPGQIAQWEFRNIRKNGSVIWVNDTVRPIVSSNGDITVLVVCEDITDRKLAETRLTYLANYDAMTNLPNRTLFYDRLTQAVTRLPWNNRLVAVLFLDIDRFKLINDTLGHGTADLMLKAIGERLMDCVREGDTVARLGGDEFTVLLADVATAEDVKVVAQKILDTIAQPFELDGHEFYVTTSIGISLCPDEGNDAVTLLKNADTAMYAAKDKEGNNFQFYAGIMGDQSSSRLMLEGSLHHALERNEFLLYYQPLIDFTTGKVAGVEALLRWNREGTLISPADFIPLAEETGLIIPIGEWVLRTACAQNKAWQDQGLPPMRVAVNLSGRQLQLPGLKDTVANILTETGLEPCYLELELTESMMQSLQATGTLRALKELGVRLAIDDFGTGYSSLSYLQRYPLHKLKIDQSFMRNLPADENNVAIVTAIVAMAQSLNLKVTAEGVETPEQLAFLRTLECDELQGYLFSRPLPMAEVTNLLVSRNFQGEPKDKPPA